jgi:hypothetical protein
MTVFESVKILICHPFRMTKRTVNIAANSAVEEDGNDAVKAVA